MPRFCARSLVVVLFSGLWVPGAQGSVVVGALSLGCSGVDVPGEPAAEMGQAGAEAQRPG